MNMMGITHDEEIIPNYIPPPKNATTSDYLKNYEDKEDPQFKTQKTNKKRENRIDTIVETFQIPIFISLIFFIFQLPLVSTLMHKYLNGLPIFKEDGNPNFYGLLLKSAMFGMVYVFSDKIIQYLSSL